MIERDVESVLLCFLLLDVCFRDAKGRMRDGDLLEIDNANDSDSKI